MTMLSNIQVSIRDWSKIITLLPSSKTDNTTANNDEGQFKPVKSSMMKGILFNRVTKILSIKFHDSPKIYTYSCELDTANELMNAKSKGKFFLSAKKAGLLKELN